MDLSTLLKNDTKHDICAYCSDSGVCMVDTTIGIWSLTESTSMMRTHELQAIYYSGMLTVLGWNIATTQVAC